MSSATRRTQGSGTLTEIRPGVWRLRVFIGKDPITGRPRQVSRTHRGGARDANKALADFVSEASKGDLGGTNASVGVLLDAWLEETERTTSPATMANYRQAVTSALRPALGHKKLSSLGTRDLDQLYGAMARAGRSPYIIRHAHSAIRAALTTARRWGWIVTNVAEDAKPPALPNKDVEAATTEQVYRLVKTLTPIDHELALIVLLAASTGCRRAELCGLRWSDWKDDRLHVRRRVIEAAGKVSEHDATKSGRPKRIVLDDVGIAALKRIRTLQEESAKQIGTELAEDGYILSYDGLGEMSRRPKSVSDAVAAAAIRAKMPNVHLHSLRHYTATELISAGIDVRTVANRLGHADPAITLRVYSHVVEEREREAAAVMGRKLKGALPKAPPRRP